MPVGISVNVIGDSAAVRAYKKVNPSRNAQITNRAFRRIATEVASNSAQNKILRGGGKGPAVAGILTSRTGIGRASIASDFADLPKSSSVGSRLIYMAFHEDPDGGARPWLKPAVDDMVPDRAETILVREWEAGVR